MYRNGYFFNILNFFKVYKNNNHYIQLPAQSEIKAITAEQPKTGPNLDH